MSFSNANQPTSIQKETRQLGSFKEEVSESSGFNQVSSLQSASKQSSAMQSSSMQSSSMQSSSTKQTSSFQSSSSSAKQMSVSSQMSSNAMSMSSQKSMSSMTSSKSVASSESNSVSFQSSGMVQQDVQQVSDAVTMPMVHNQEIQQEVLKTQIVSAITDLEGDREFVDFGRENKPIDLTSPPQTYSPTPKTAFTPTKQDPFSPSKQDMFSPPPLEPMEPPKPQPVLSSLPSEPTEFTPPTRNGIQNGFSEFVSSSKNLEVQTIQESSQTQSFQMNGNHEESGSIQGSSSSSSLLQKIMTPAPLEYDSGSLKRRDPRKMFTDSSFYNSKHHPTVADQVEMAHRLSSALFKEGNKGSKGQQMYLNRAKKSGDQIGEEEESPRNHGNVPNLKLVMNPGGKVHEWNDLDPADLPDAGMVAGHALPTGNASLDSPDIINPMVEDLNSSSGKCQLHRPNSFVSAYRRVFDQNRGVFGPRSPKIDAMGSQKLDFKLDTGKVKNSNTVIKQDTGQNMAKQPEGKNSVPGSPKIGFGQKLDAKFDTLTRQKLGLKSLLSSKHGDSKTKSPTSILQSATKSGVQPWHSVPSMAEGSLDAKTKVTKLSFTQSIPSSPVAPKRTLSACREASTKNMPAKEEQSSGDDKLQQSQPMRIMMASKDIAPASAYPASPRPNARYVSASKAESTSPMVSTVVEAQVKALKTVEDASKALKEVETPKAALSKASKISNPKGNVPDKLKTVSTTVLGTGLATQTSAIRNPSVNEVLLKDTFSNNSSERPTKLSDLGSMEIHSPVFSRISPVTSPKVSFAEHATAKMSPRLTTSKTLTVNDAPLAFISKAISSAMNSSPDSSPAKVSSPKTSSIINTSSSQPYTQPSIAESVSAVASLKTPDSSTTVHPMSTTRPNIAVKGRSSNMLPGSPNVTRRMPTAAENVPIVSPSLEQTCSDSAKNLQSSPIVGRRIPLSSTNQNIISFFEQKHSASPTTPTVARKISFKKQPGDMMNSKPVFPTDTMKDFNTESKRAKPAFTFEPKTVEFATKSTDFSPKSVVTSTTKVSADQQVFNQLPTTSMVAKTKALFENKENIHNYPMPGLKKSRTFSSFPTDFGVSKNSSSGGSKPWELVHQPSPPKRSSSRKVIAEYQA